MRETEWAFAPWVAGGITGGIWGGAGYAWGAYQGHYKWDNAKCAGNVATGAVIGTSLVLWGQLPVEESNLFPA